MTEPSKPQPPKADDQRESGKPGGGAGRRDEVGSSGVYPASAGNVPPDAQIRTPMSWGQGERGAAGYEDSGESELWFAEEELRAAKKKKGTPASSDQPAEPRKGMRDDGQ